MANNVARVGGENLPLAPLMGRHGNFEAQQVLDLVLDNNQPLEKRVDTLAEAFIMGANAMAEQQRQIAEQGRQIAQQGGQIAEQQNRINAEELKNQKVSREFREFRAKQLEEEIEKRLDSKNSERELYSLLQKISLIVPFVGIFPAIYFEYCRYDRKKIKKVTDLLKFHWVVKNFPESIEDPKVKKSAEDLFHEQLRYCATSQLIGIYSQVRDWWEQREWSYENIEEESQRVFKEKLNELNEYLNIHYKITRSIKEEEIPFNFVKKFNLPLIWEQGFRPKEGPLKVVEVVKPFHDKAGPPPVRERRDSGSVGSGGCGGAYDCEGLLHLI
ncbi:MAG: hypothetical protein WB791_07100 [Waddliaceae bacterium]